MLNWFKKERHKEYKDKLRSTFPKSLEVDVEAVLAILPFDDNNVKRKGYGVIKVDNLIFPSGLIFCFNGELLNIPYRIYFNEPDTEEENNLTDVQKVILNCIFLRHFDGYLRQRRLEKIVDKSEEWIIPYTIQLLGEYVFEILEVLDKHINSNNIGNYVKFARENPKYWPKIESRMISYWNAYYRWKYPRLKKYLGQQIASRIKKSEGKTAYLQ